MPAILGTLSLVTIAATAAAQIWAGGYGRTPPRFATATTFQGGFNFCRALFQSDRREKQGWSTDYPGADINFSIRLGELTKTNITMRDDSTEGPEPEAIVPSTAGSRRIPMALFCAFLRAI